MRSRHVGVKAGRHRKQQERFRQVGQDVGSEYAEHVERAMALFREKLLVFAQEHRQDIAQNPQFRAKFHMMCREAGVDPLASNKGFWAEMLGLGDFYYALSVQIVDVCAATRCQNGGMIPISALLSKLTVLRGDTHKISADDVYKAVDKLRDLGNGLRIERFGSEKVVLSIPTELNVDHTRLVEVAQDTACISVQGAMAQLGWTEQRAIMALQSLMQSGLVWVDTKGQDHVYWFPSFFLAQ